MTAISSAAGNYQVLSSNQRVAWANAWHEWSVIIPRRTITGRLVRGQVWRRHNGRHWIYKKFSQHSTDVTRFRAGTNCWFVDWL
jgi:hypothetical protein